MPAHGDKVEMAVQMDVTGRRNGAIVQAVVREPVYDDMVVSANETLNDSVTCRPARRIQHDFFHLEEVGDLAFERNGLEGIANQRGGAGAMHAAAFDRFLGGCLDCGIR